MAVLLRSLGSYVVSLAVVTACSSSDSTNSDNPDPACADLANALCDRLEACAPYLRELQYPDVATCKARAKRACVAPFGAPGVNATTAKVESCAHVLPQVSCEDVLRRNVPAECRTAPGTLADGAACQFDNQCAGATCRKKDRDATCGTCGAPADTGEPCVVSDDCNYGLTCSDAKKCVRLGAIGDACDKDKPCVTATCSAGTCTVPKPAGTTCNPGADDCDVLHGIFCTQAKTCEVAKRAKDGEACGIVGGAYVGCEGGTCFSLAGVSSSCRIRLNEGATCVSGASAPCLAPAKCIDLKCTLPEPNACSK